MNKFFYILLALCILMLIALLVLARLSANDEAPGLMAGKLVACPAKPNCVSSEFKGDNSPYVKPLKITINDPLAAFELLAEIITTQNGQIVRQENSYLAATFRSKLFRFVDDFEARLDAPANEIHIRSAARAGYSDMEVNRDRLEHIRAKFTAAQR